jgi:hypothetical protein
MAAGKETGASCSAPISKLRLVQSYQFCPHTATRTTRLPDSHPHFARLTCAICGGFLRWLPRPSTIERRTLNAFKLARLAMRPDLTSWERQFICSVRGEKNLSPKQEAIIARLVTQYLEGKPS